MQSVSRRAGDALVLRMNNSRGMHVECSAVPVHVEVPRMDSAQVSVARGQRTCSVRHVAVQLVVHEQCTCSARDRIRSVCLIGARCTRLHAQCMCSARAAHMVSAGSTRAVHVHVHVHVHAYEHVLTEQAVCICIARAVQEECRSGPHARCTRSAREINTCVQRISSAWAGRKQCMHEQRRSSA